MAPNSIETLRLLAVSSEPAVLHSLNSLSGSQSWHLETSASGWEAMERVQSGSVLHLLLLDLPSGDTDRLHLLPWLRRFRPTLPIFVVCDPADLDGRKEAIRLGAKEVLTRPINRGQFESLVGRHLGTWEGTEAEMASEDIESLGDDEVFLSISPSMQQLRAQAELLAQSDVPVLILGETGSGKGTLGRLIHQKSVYSGFKFFRVNCAEMPADLLEMELFGRGGSFSREAPNGNRRSSFGKLEAGQKGTVLLDEISEMPLALQSKLFNMLQDKRLRLGGDKSPEIDVRILAASSDKLDCALAEKRLHAELYYRLSAFTMQVPPLRQRKEEISLLLRCSMHKAAKRYGLSPREFSQSALDACLAHSWPGNLKELESFVKRYLVAGEEGFAASEFETTVNTEIAETQGKRAKLSLTHRPDNNGSLSPLSLKTMIQNVRWETEKNAIAAALDKTGWNRKAAARLLGVSYRSILYKIDQYEMSAPESYVSVFGSRLVPPGPVKGTGKAS